MAVSCQSLSSSVFNGGVLSISLLLFLSRQFLVEFPLFNSYLFFIPSLYFSLFLSIYFLQKVEPVDPNEEKEESDLTRLLNQINEYLGSGDTIADDAEWLPLTLHDRKAGKIRNMYVQFNYLFIPIFYHFNFLHFYSFTSLLNSLFIIYYFSPTFLFTLTLLMSW